MGGKFNIKLVFFWFWGEGFKGIWGELGGEGHQKALKTRIFINFRWENAIFH